MTPPRLLDRALLEDPARPLLTYYDHAGGVRVELSVATFANWVAKTANLLVDGLTTRPGQRVAVGLPVHWQAAVWHAACWAAGLVSVVGPAPAGVDVAVVPFAAAMGARPAGELAAADEVVGLRLQPLGLPTAEPAPAYVTLDFDREIHAYGDRFRGDAGLADDRPALDDGRTVHTAAELANGTADWLRPWSLPPGARLLSVRPLDDLRGVQAALLAGLSTGGGTVLCRDADLHRLPATASTENVVAVAGLAEDVLPGLAHVA